MASLKALCYRPRVIDGAAVATPDLNFAIEFCMDQTERMPTCKGKGDISVAR